MNCQSRTCRNPATWIRPNAIHGCANALCDTCMIRIYHGFPHHTTAWEKLSPQTNPVNPVPTVNPVTQPTNEQPTLF